MSPPARVLLVGLTGGIASGKSTVGAILAELGAHVIDADELAKDALEPGRPGHAAVLRRFGADLAGDDGRIDRERLARIVFADADARRALEAIVHPEVLAGFQRRVGALRGGDEPRVAVFDAALLVESGADREMDRVIVVSCKPETQVRRLAERDRIGAQAARARIAAQAPLAEKLAAADYVIDTDRPLQETRRRTREVWEALLGSSLR